MNCHLTVIDAHCEGDAVADGVGGTVVGAAELAGDDTGVGFADAGAAGVVVGVADVVCAEAGAGSVGVVGEVGVGVAEAVADEVGLGGAVGHNAEA